MAQYQCSKQISDCMHCRRQPSPDVAGHGPSRLFPSASQMEHFHLHKESVTQLRCVAVPFLVLASYSSLSHWQDWALLSRLIVKMILSRFHFHLHQQTLSRGHRNDLHLPKMVRTACGTRYGVVISPREYCLGSK